MAKNINMTRGYTTAEIIENNITDYPENKIFYANSIIKANQLSQQIRNEKLTALLQKKIGRTVMIEYLSGSGVIGKSGKIAEVGEDYVLLKSKTRTVYCDISAIKFVTVF